MRKTRLALTVIVAFQIFSCDSASENPIEVPHNQHKTITVQKPTKKEIAKLIKKDHLNLKSDKIVVSQAKTLYEECDGVDNNNNGLIDENCFGCFSNAARADFDGDGQVTVYDCSFPMLVAHSKTLSKNSIDCVDIDNDGTISIGDTLLCGELARGHTLLK